MNFRQPFQSFLLFIVFSLFLSCAAHAQTLEANPNVNSRPSASAVMIETEPVIDGEVLNDEANTESFLVFNDVYAEGRVSNWSLTLKYMLCLTYSKT